MKTINLLSGYLFLISGIITGIAANGYLKTTEGFTKINPTIFCLVSIIICMFSLSKAMSVIPVGFTYATYGALTITAVTLFGVFKYNQTPNIYGLIGLSLIVLGVILLNTLGNLK
ncbi:SMR family transporter [Pelagibacteraceae bacterium]|jgi:small multidrug resistance pump|nr:SMR family transporter [Pelagibacteraceae bacterium]MDC1158231.1 SMR family transporter [Pelagibacteraceae bacterium]